MFADSSRPAAANATSRATKLVLSLATAAIAAFAFASSSLAFTGPPNFSVAPGSPNSVGTSPHSVALGDLNGDGNPDLATANSGSNDVTVLLGNGSGGFSVSAGSPFSVGTSPHSVALGDLNGDGNPDLATANSGSNDVTVLLGNGSGGFSPALGPFSVGTSPNSVAVRDLNGDGNPDLVTADVASNDVTVLLGNGSGGFSPAPGSPFSAGVNPYSVTIGDLNGDGNPDLVIANPYNYPHGGSYITVLLGDGSGGFSGAPTGPEGNGTISTYGDDPLSVAIGDLNGDGNPDLATANSGGNNISALFGDGSGEFSLFSLGTYYSPHPATRYGGISPVSVAIGDLNGDGNPDLVALDAITSRPDVNGNSPGYVVTLLGDGSGDFTSSERTFDVGASPLSAAIGDLNGDGKPDLATANSGDDNVSVLLNTTAIDAPAVNASPATNVGVASATLSGLVDPDGSGDVTNCYFEYGTDISYGSAVPCSPATPYSSPTNVSGDLSGLASDTTYHFHIVASNANGMNLGQDQTFKTSRAGAFETHPFMYSFGSLNSPNGVAIDNSSGDVYVLDAGSNVVDKFTSSGNLIPSWGSGGQLDGSNTPAGSFSEYQPLGGELAVDNSAGPNDGDLYVTDLFNSVVDRFDSSGNYLSQISFGDYPTGVAVDLFGNVYVTGYFNSQVSVFDQPGNLISQFATITQPAGVAVSSNGNVYVVNGSEADAYDSSGNFVRQVDANPSYSVAIDPASDDVYVVQGSDIAQFDSTGSEVGTFGSANLNNPRGIAVDPSTGDVYVSNGTGGISVFGPGIALNNSANEAVAVGGTAATNTTTSPADPTGTSVTTPVAGTVTIEEGSITTSDPSGYTFLGEQIEITAPAAGAANPLVLQFSLDASLLPPGIGATTLQVFRNGVAIADCAAGSGTSATPDPCVAARAASAGGGVELTVRTSHASTWNFGVGVSSAPATVTLSPPDAVNNVGTSHTVTATVKASGGQPVAAVVTRFAVSGSVSITGSCTTTVDGTCSFSYAGPEFPGADQINAYADSNGNGAQNPGEPAATPATKAWILPTSTTGQVTGGGQIANAAANDKIAFGFTVKSDSKGLKGNCNLVDPSTKTKLDCGNVTAMTVSGTQATIYGDAVINGQTTTYKITVNDLGEPGIGKDTFTIHTATGYQVGGSLKAGNVQVH